MDDERLAAEVEEFVRVLREAGSIEARLRRAVERSRALIDASFERLDRRGERDASLPARHLTRISHGASERDRFHLVAEDQESLERAMIREIARRVREGWAVVGIAYPPRGENRAEVALDFERPRPDPHP